jgi:hypothetical protein
MKIDGVFGAYRTQNSRQSSSTGKETVLVRNDEGRTRIECGLRKNVRRRPSLPPPGGGSTIGAEGLSFRVRNGTGRFPFAMAAETRYAVDCTAMTGAVAERCTRTRANRLLVLGSVVKSSAY